VLGSVQLTGGRRHAEQLAPAIDYLRAECGVDLGDLAAIAVGTGPGLFTGLRVGVTTAKVMAQALRIPVVGVPSLDLVAYPLRYSGRAIVAVLDARRREVFAARYQPVPGGVQRTSEYAVHEPAELVGDLLADIAEYPHGLLLAGDGVARFPAEFAALEHAEVAGPEFAAPSVSALIALATARFEREEFEQPGDLRPLYLRQSDAEIAWDQRSTVGTK
jgi:tRNA threonylcarbamoyladenosine biosynthesis protein TsaB